MISYFSRKKGYINYCEDSFTALLFDLLKYLPIDISWEILQKSLLQDNLPNVNKDFLSIHFWDKWKTKAKIKTKAKATTNLNYVEPDVFIRFDNFDVIIEAKRNDEKGQCNIQITDEIRAYVNEFGCEKNRLYFIQLGGLTNKKNIDDDNNITVTHCKTNWSRILEQVVYKRNSLENHGEPHHKRILDDLIEGFELHGYFKMFWLKDLKQTAINNSKITWFDYAK